MIRDLETFENSECAEPGEIAWINRIFFLDRWTGI
jgi:hypothetical protein